MCAFVLWPLLYTVLLAADDRIDIESSNTTPQKQYEEQISVQYAATEADRLEMSAELEKQREIEEGEGGVVGAVANEKPGSTVDGDLVAVK